MAAEYRVRLPDGNEYGPAVPDTLRAWYLEGRIGREAYVLGPEDAQWRLLGEAFDLATWANPVSDAAPAYPSSETDPKARPVRPEPRGQKGGPPWGLLVGVALLVILVVLGALVALRSLFPASGARERAFSQWASPDRAYADPTLGVGLSVPKGWIILRKESPLVPMADARVSFAHPPLAALAVLRVEALTSGISSLDAYLDHVLERTRLMQPSIKDLGRSDLLLGKVPARRMLTSWNEGGQEVRGRATVWQDAWNYFQLSGWCPEGDSPRVSEEFERLEKGLEIQGLLGARIEEVATKAMTAAPQLSKTAAEMLARDGLIRGLTPEQLAEKSYEVAAKGFIVLSRDELKEMSDILALVYKPMTEKDRARLAAYLNRVKAGRASAQDDDDEMREAMKNGLLALPDESRARLQAIFEKAIAAGLVAR